jgi:hypothetical protein
MQTELAPPLLEPRLHIRDCDFRSADKLPLALSLVAAGDDVAGMAAAGDAVAGMAAAGDEVAGDTFMRTTTTTSNSYFV